MRNRTEHGLSWLTAISDAGSTPAASTILSDLRISFGSRELVRTEFWRPCAIGDFGRLRHHP